MSLTTYVVLAIEHDPDTTPELWDWEALGDHPGRIDLLAHAQTATSDENGLSEQVRSRWEAEWLALALEAPLCLRCGSSRDNPDPTCSLCFRRSRVNTTP
jgi:hypothetical protein